MKKILPFLLLLFISVLAQGQTLGHKLTPYLYLGAPKDKLIEFATTHARLAYETNLYDVIGKQKSKGVKLKKKDDLQRFVSEMVADIKARLEATNDWNGQKIDIWKKYAIDIETLLGAGIQLKGFDELIGTQQGRATLFFRDGKVVNIHYTRDVTSVLNPTKIIPLTAQIVEQVGDILEKHYDDSYKGKTVDEKTHWNSDHAIYDRRIDRYKCLKEYEDIFGDDAGKVGLDVTIYYEPYGREINNKYYYRGQALTTFVFHLWSEE